MNRILLVIPLLCVVGGVMLWYGYGTRDNVVSGPTPAESLKSQSVSKGATCVGVDPCLYPIITDMFGMRYGYTAGDVPRVFYQPYSTQFVELPNADAHSLVHVSGDAEPPAIVADRAHVYCGHAELSDLDRSTLRIIDRYFFADANTVYQRYTSGSVHDGVWCIRRESLDPQTLVRVSPPIEGGVIRDAYYKDAKDVYFVPLAKFEWDGTIQSLHADPATFKARSDGTGVDAFATYTVDLYSRVTRTPCNGACQ